MSDEEGKIVLNLNSIGRHFETVTRMDLRVYPTSEKPKVLDSQTDPTLFRLLSHATQNSGILCSHCISIIYK